MKHRPSITTGALMGAVTSLPLIGLLFFGERFAGLPFIPFDLFDWLARVLPGDVITFGIDLIVQVIATFNLGSTSDSAKLIEQLMGLATVVGGGAAIGAAIAWLMGRTALSGTVLGLLGGGVALLMSLVAVASLGPSGNPLLAYAWVTVLILGWGSLLGGWIEQDATDAARAGNSAEARRAALVRIAGGSAAVALGAWGLGRILGPSSASGADQELAQLTTAAPDPTATAQPTPVAEASATAASGTTPEAGATAIPEATPTVVTRETVQPVAGTRPELTPNDDFYRIDINTRPVVIDQEDWVLEVGGLVDNPQQLTLDDLLAFPAVTQPVTMSCISNSVGGDLIGTSNWTGIRMRDLMKEWGVRPEGQVLYIESADGFYEYVVAEDLMDPRTMLVYGMNGKTLPVEHGFPLRIYIANRYGMKQPKWITRFEFVEAWEPGYWVVRGWSREARPRIVSVIDAVADSANDAKAVGGIAWAGDRGIQKVELQVDGGEWQEAILRLPPLGPLTWVQWRYEWPATAGRHTLRVRATDGTGDLQIAEENPKRPDGATGYHEVNVNV